MEAHPEVGVCASKILVCGTETIDTTGHLFSHLLKGFKRGEGEKSFLCRCIFCR